MTATKNFLHVDTHHDAIWYSGCLQQERSIVKRFQQISPRILVKPVDAVCIMQSDLDAYPLVVTDNQFLHKPSCNVIDLAPFFWGIYHCAAILNTTEQPSKLFNCMINRISGERQRMLYQLYSHGLLDQGHVSYNCLYHAPDPGIDQRKINFDTVRADCDLIGFDDAHHDLKSRVPLLLNMTPDDAAMDSKITLVMETYVSNWVIAISEKIFRVLQTPRPWLVYCTPGTVRMLREHGFDVLDDYVDHHRYDSIENHWQRMDTIVDMIKNFNAILNHARLAQAAAHNRALLASFKEKLPAHIAHCVQSTDDLYHARSNTKSSD